MYRDALDSCTSIDEPLFEQSLKRTRVLACNTTTKGRAQSQVQAVLGWQAGLPDSQASELGSVEQLGRCSEVLCCSYCGNASLESNFIILQGRRCGKEDIVQVDPGVWIFLEPRMLKTRQILLHQVMTRNARKSRTSPPVTLNSPGDFS